MKTLHTLGFVLLLASAWPGAASAGVPAVRVKHAPAAVAPAPVLTPDERRKLLEQIDALAKDQQDQLAAKDAINAHLVATVTDQAAALATAQGHVATLQKTSRDIAGQVGSLDAQLGAEKWGRFKDRIFGWPIAVGIGVVLGLGLALFSRVGLWAAGLAAKVGLKATTGV